MVTLRCTRKILDKLPRSSGLATESESLTPLLGDWYVTYLTCRPKHLLLCVSEHSRLAVMFPAAPLTTFTSRFLQALREVLQDSGISEMAIAAEIEKMATYQFGPTQNRSLLGTMNEYVKTLEYQEGDGETLTPVGQSQFLNQMIWRPIEYKTPEEVTRRLLESNQ